MVPRPLLPTAVLAAGFCWLAFGSAVAAEPGSALALKRVLLSTGGVGYFEYEATVSGNAELSLSVRRDRVDDVLKSIVVYDDNGGIGTISLPGREPLREAFRELPFGPEALESPLALLQAVRGSEMRLSGSRELIGRLVAVTEESERLPNNGGTVTRHRLSLITAEGLRQVILEDTDTIRLTDARLQGQVDLALAALAQHSERDRRTLTLHTTGQGDRTIRVAYVVEAPLWKTAYRLTLEAVPGDGAAPAAKAEGGLQGWAVLENLSGEDWSGVDLTVVSGNPVTFRQALYDAYYVSRPAVPVEVLGRVLPGVDEGSVAVPADTGPPRAQAELQDRARAMARRGDDEKSMTRRGMAIGAVGGTVERPLPPPEAAPAAPGRLADLTAAESSEATTQVTFHHPGPVSVANGHSLLLPIVNRSMPAVRQALFQPATQPRHPLAAVRLTNDGATGLPPGILTLYERGADGKATFVGDARLGALPAGQGRLVSFAVDQKVTIDQKESQTQTLSQGRIVDGALHVTTTQRRITLYTIAGAPREARQVVIEHPREADWTLVGQGQTGGPLVEATATAWRLVTDVPAGKTVTLTVTTERPSEERFELSDLGDEQVGIYASAPELPPKLRQAFVRLAELRAAVTTREQTVSRLESDQESLEKNQERLRENLQAVGKGSDLAKRYLAKLAEQEDRHDKLERDLAAARTAVETAQQAVADYVRTLKF